MSVFTRWVYDVSPPRRTARERQHDVDEAELGVHEQAIDRLGVVVAELRVVERPAGRERSVRRAPTSASRRRRSPSADDQRGLRVPASPPGAREYRKKSTDEFSSRKALTTPTPGCVSASSTMADRHSG